ncbi:tetratricopeptide repeat protein, partial [candidate division WOR-3 bacterium]|nr:tetratricopeptide repeat protein [candidate division WOR-3 bacterium]
MKIDTRYKILSKISENNNNVLYSVSDKKTGQIIALKFLKNLDADHITRFRREYFILQTLIHPNIVKVFDIGSTKYQQKEHPYFTMEFVDGMQVNQYFKINGFKNFITLFLDILRTINFIHKKGLLHSDLKPHHILVTKNGMIKLVDFGFALFQKSKLYKEFGGTLRYIAPEILKGENPDVRSEIYSLGIILYECLSGKDAFGERTIKNIIESVLYKSLPPIIKKKNVPGFINQIIMKMSNKLRMNRHSSIESVIEEVENKGKVSKKRKNIEKVLYSDFIGRKEYLDITYDLLKKSANNNGQILLVEGITGIGKTRLLKEIEYRLFLQGETVQYKRVAEKEEFNFDWLMQFLKRSDINLTSITDEYSNGSLNLSGNRKYIFFEKVERVLSQISSEKVQVIIIDEINTGYKIIWEFLLYISSFIEKNKILIIGATERVPDEFIKTCKQGTYENIRKLSLKGLNKEEAIHLIGNLLGVSENVENLATFLYEKTEGNPYFIEELLKELVERRLLKKSANNLIYGLSELKIIPIPENVETFVQNRLKKLSDEEKEILKIAAVYGESIPVLSLIALSPLNELNTTKISEHLYLSQFFSIYNDEYNFSHKILRKIIYNEIKENERILIHKKVFEFLKALKETPLLINQKAHHAYSAGMPEAKSLLLRALKIAIKSNNYDNAVDAFKKLQDTFETFLFEKVEIDSIIKIGYFYTLLGNLGDAILLFESYLPRVIKKEGKVKVLHRLAVVKTIACEYNKAERIYEDLLKITRKTDMKFEVLLDRGWLYFVKGDYAEAEGNYKVALSMSEKITNKVLLCRLFTNLGILKLQTELFSDANEYGKKSLVYSKRFKNQSYINAALNLLGRIEQQRKRFKGAILYYKKVLKSLEKSKDILRALSIFMSLSNCYYQLGKYDLCEENLFKAINLARKLGKLYEIAFLYNLSGSLNLRKGRWQSADDYFTRSLEIGFSINNYIIQFCNLIDLSLISVLRGKKDRFKEYLEKANKLRKDVTDEKELLSLYLVKGIEKYIAEDYKKCISYISNIENTIENIEVPEYQIPALIYKGLSLSKINRKNEALDAVKIAKRMVHKHNFALYEEEAELAEIEIISDEVTVELRKRLNKMISDTDKKKEKFLHARGLMLLSDIKLKEFNRRKSRKLLIESIDSLKEAKKIFQDIDAQPFIANINNRFSELFDVFLQYGDVELKSKKYLEIMKELGKTIINLGNLDELKERFLSLAKSITGAERGLFLTFEPDTEDFAITGKDMDIATINDAKRISKSVIQKVRMTKKPIISYDAVQDRRFGKNESVLINEIRSLLCI